MLFNSFAFLIFFVVVTTLYFVLPHKVRWFLLLAASCYFYMAFVPIYILILGFTIVIDYFAGIYIEKSHGKRRKMFLVCSLIANIGILAIFKYYNFINENISLLLHGAGFVNHIPYLSLLLPIGLSFHTFQAMSYTVEVYRGNQKAERNFGIYSLYVMFYPQLVAGPIERPQNLLHQFREKHEFDYDRIVEGLKQMLWGFFKKVVIADRLALYVTEVYGHPKEVNGYSFILATVFFAFQVYCDFSGYSDIAIGAAKVMGFKLMTNFDRPFISKNVTEFWRRWHISLSTWLRDYIYTPISIATRNWETKSILFALMVTFLVSGIWHGAGWNFIIFGALQGIASCWDVLTKKARKRISKSMNAYVYNSVSILLTFSYQCLAWIFFRSSSTGEAFLILKKIAHLHGKLYLPNASTIVYSFGAIILLLIFEFKNKTFDFKLLAFSNKRGYIRYSSYCIMILLILLVGVFDGGQFIYFQF